MSVQKQSTQDNDIMTYNLGTLSEAELLQLSAKINTERNKRRKERVKVVPDTKIKPIKELYKVLIKEQKNLNKRIDVLEKKVLKLCEEYQIDPYDFECEIGDVGALALGFGV